jgi:hypothetical protein
MTTSFTLKAIHVYCLHYEICHQDFRDLRNTRDVKMTMLNDGRRGECFFDFLEILVTMTFTVTLCNYNFAAFSKNLPIVYRV